MDAVVEMDSELEMVEIEVETGELYKVGAKKGQPKWRKEVKDVGGYSLYWTSNQTGKAISMTSMLSNLSYIEE